MSSIVNDIDLAKGVVEFLCLRDLGALMYMHCKAHVELSPLRSSKLLALGFSEFAASHPFFTVHRASILTSWGGQFWAWATHQDCSVMVHLPTDTGLLLTIRGDIIWRVGNNVGRLSSPGSTTNSTSLSATECDRLDKFVSGAKADGSHFGDIANPPKTPDGVWKWLRCRGRLITWNRKSAYEEFGVADQLQFNPDGFVYINQRGSATWLARVDNSLALEAGNRSGEFVDTHDYMCTAAW
jgi:hypothetical protein